MNANRAWAAMIQDIIVNGKHRETRGTKSIELIGYQTRISMQQPVLSLVTRKLGYKFQAAEAHWILSGDNKVESIAPYSKEISKFSDDGVVFAGAYGPKVLEQISYVVYKLSEDPGSRQAVINIWRESPAPSRDIPCTLSLQFLLDDNVINCVASMRSSDAWLGWPYDVFNFSCISAYVALLLPGKPELGQLVLNAGSQHLYERDMPGVQHYFINEDDQVESPKFNTTMFGSLERLMNELSYWKDDKGSLEGLRSLQR